MIVTANLRIPASKVISVQHLLESSDRMPVPLPMAPMKSATMVSMPVRHGSNALGAERPIHMPPKAAAMGTYLDSQLLPWPFRRTSSGRAAATFLGILWTSPSRLIQRFRLRAAHDLSISQHLGHISRWRSADLTETERACFWNRLNEVLGEYRAWTEPWQWKSWE